MEVVAINRTTCMVMLEDGTMLPIQGWHHPEEKDEVDPDVATFVTFQMPNGKWSYAILSDFNSRMH